MPRGGARKGAGRSKGVPNKATAEFKEKLNELLEHAAPNMVRWLDEIAADNPEKAFDILSKFAEYCYPKLARHTHEGDQDKPIEINVTRTVKSARDND